MILMVSHSVSVLYLHEGSLDTENEPRSWELQHILYWKSSQITVTNFKYPSYWSSIWKAILVDWKWFIRGRKEVKPPHPPQSSRRYEKLTFLKGFTKQVDAKFIKKVLFCFSFLHLHWTESVQQVLQFPTKYWTIPVILKTFFWWAFLSLASTAGLYFESFLCSCF